MISVGEDVEKLKPLYTAGRYVKFMVVPQKVKHRLQYYPKISLLGIHQKKKWKEGHKEILTYTCL